MRTLNLARFVLVTIAVGFSAHSSAFEAKETPAAAAIPGAAAVVPGSVTPFQAFRSGTQSYLAGEKEKAAINFGK